MLQMGDAGRRKVITISALVFVKEGPFHLCCSLAVAAGGTAVSLCEFDGPSFFSRLLIDVINREIDVGESRVILLPCCYYSKGH
jgi:hypothetical protein